VNDWTELPGERPCRFFLGPCHFVERASETLEVFVSGVQYVDATVEQVITVDAVLHGDRRRFERLDVTRPRRASLPGR
jgi:hypothetical protein